MALGGEPVDLGVAGVLVRDEEGRPDAATVWVEPRLAGAELVGVAEDFLVVIEDELIDGAAERE